MAEIDKGTVEPTKNEHAITEVPINSNFKHITLDEENDSEVDNFADAYSQVDVEENDPYDYNDYTSNYESDYEESDEQKEIDLTQENKVDKNTNISSDVQGQTLISSSFSNDDISNVNEKPEISSTIESRTEISTEGNKVENTIASTITSNDQGQNSISNTSSNGEVSNEKKIDEKTDIDISPITAQLRRENASRTSSTDSFQTDVSEKENSNVSDHESDTSYEKDELEKGEKIIRPIDQDKIRTDSGKDIVTTEVESKPGSSEEVLPSTLKSDDDSGEDKLGNSLDNLIEKTSNSSSEETEDKSGENNEIEEKSDKFNKKLVENSPMEITSETVADNKVISESSVEFKNKKLENINSNANYGENPQNIPDHKPEILPINTSFSSFSSEYKQNVRDSMTESFTSKPNGFSSISMYQSVDFTNERENTNTILEKNALNRISVASLRENPELNDISLDDESSNINDSPKEWNFSDWGFPKTPTSLKSISTFFSPRSTTSTVTSTSSKSSSSSDSRRMSTVSMTSTGSNYDLLLARLERENQLLQEDPKAKRMSLQGIAELKASFERVQHEAQIDDGIDWDFWGEIISDYETVARTQPRQLSKMIQKGIPQALRGMIWQLMSKSKDSELESTYAQLLKETSTHEKMIMRDLNRTFPKHEFFQDQDGLGQEGLFNVVKAYSLYDTEVGYCQGISFVVGPLLLNMPDEEAFCVLVKLMTFYNMRSHFLPGMDGLQLRLYQFDRLVEEMLPKVHNHLQAQGINSSMYASQWFMTLFAYKFPLSLVFRIYDTIFTEGIEAIFRFSIALLKKNEKRIVEMEFETLLEYLKSGLFENYQINHTGVLAQLVKETQYHTNDFVKDAYNIRITPKKLNKYQQAYYAHQEAEKRKLLAETEAIEKLRSNNSQLSSRVKQLESSLQTLNREHVELANELINTRMELAKSDDENKELHSTVEELRKTIELQPAEVEAKLREEMNILAEKNISLVQKNNLLEDQLANLENMLIESKMRYAESENEREVLQRKWNDLKKALG